MRSFAREEQKIVSLSLILYADKNLFRILAEYSPPGMPIVGNVLKCPNPSCGHPQPDVNFTNCENCGYNLGPPNVNIVSTDTEINALQKRYDDAKKYAAVNGVDKVLNHFESFFSANVNAIINVTLATLDKWIVKSGAYKSYHRGVEEGLRPIANFFNDQKRTAIDSLLYGTYGRDINFAALTLNGEGLESYGNCRVVINEGSIESRSSLLEENPYTFVKTHHINFETLKIPPGYRSTWLNKLKLAVAKLHQKLALTSTEKDFSKMVLLNTGDRDTDDFLEVHIYKELSYLSVQHIFVPAPKNPLDTATVTAIEHKCPGKVTRI